MTPMAGGEGGETRSSRVWSLLSDKGGESLPSGESLLQDRTSIPAHLRAGYKPRPSPQSPAPIRRISEGEEDGAPGFGSAASAGRSIFAPPSPTSAPPEPPLHMSKAMQEQMRKLEELQAGSFDPADTRMSTESTSSDLPHGHSAVFDAKQLEYIKQQQSKQAAQQQKKDEEAGSECTVM